jgi:Uma2 family endonuclease
MHKALFLAWVEGREEGYELADGRVVRMQSRSRAGAEIAANMFRLLDSRLDPERWTILFSFGIDVGPKTVRFPDVLVDSAAAAPRELTARAPVLIADVLWHSREVSHLGHKAAEYLPLQSLAAYLVFAQDEQKAWIWLRGAQGFPPGPQVLNVPNEIIRVAALGIEFPLAEVYARVQLD